jgi:exodeoxyribonuclease V alpha subunit
LSTPSETGSTPRRLAAPDDPVETLRGTVERITYRHPESFYTVLRVSLEEDTTPGELFGRRGPVAHAVGKAPEVPVGSRVALEGSWKKHPRHGPQFHFRTLQVLPPRDRAGLVRLLSSKAFPGIGPVTAEKIVTTLGADALERIEADPEVLRAVPGLKAASRSSLASAIRAQRGERELQAFLYGLELNSAQVLEAARALGPRGEALVRANPYLLTRTVRGVGFVSADRAARKLGLEDDSPERREAGLLHVLESAASDGHACQDTETLRERTEELLGLAIPPETLAGDLERLVAGGLLTLDASTRPERCLAYLPHLFTAENELASNLAHLVRSGPVRPLCLPETLQRAERAAGLTLHVAQRHAVEGCLSSAVALLTGGPGVGKTTIVRLVVELAERAGLAVALASPTGRAAKRMQEATGRPASTVHRLLGWDPVNHRFEHDARNPLGAGLVIVDEISMLDTILAHHLVKAIQPPARLVLVGDPDQLPSVAAGNVLADLLASARIPVFRLSQVYRQESGGLIVANAHRILAGELPSALGRDDPVGEFYVFPAEGDEAAAARLIEVVTQRIPRRFGLDWAQDVQVLAPMYRGACGVDAINDALRSALGWHGPELAWRDRVWREGDRVIQTRNDYDRQVFNGDMGRIVRVDPQRKALRVRFPEREIEYAAEDLGDLSCAFAITVHRSQGGEFPAVVLPLVTSHWPMLQRNLLYTAVTRAKRLVVLVGSRRALERAVANAEPSQRESALAERLREACAGPC